MTIPSQSTDSKSNKQTGKILLFAGGLLAGIFICLLLCAVAFSLSLIGVTAQKKLNAFVRTPEPTNTATPALPPTETPTPTGSLAAEATLDAELDALAPSFKIDLKGASADYQRLEKDGTIGILYDVNGNPSVFVVLQGKYAISPDIWLELKHTQTLLNRYDPGFLASTTRQLNLAAIYYSEEFFRVHPDYSATNLLVDAKSNPDNTASLWPHFNGHDADLVPTQYSVILLDSKNQSSTADYYGEDLATLVSGTILHETFERAFDINVPFNLRVGPTNLVYLAEQSSHEQALEWLDKHVPKSDPNYQMLKKDFDEAWQFYLDNNPPDRNP